MAVTNADILAYYNQNKNTSHAQIASDMDKYGVTPEQFALATGLDAAGVTNAYNVAKSSSAPTTSSASLSEQNYATTNSPSVSVSGNNQYGALGQTNPSITKNMIQDYYSNAQKTGMTAAQIASDMDKYGVSTSDFAAATGMNSLDVLYAYLDNTGRSASAKSSGAFPVNGAKSMPANSSVSDADIQAWWKQNSGIGNEAIAAAMLQYNVSPEQFARASGSDLKTVEQLYNATNVVKNHLAQAKSDKEKIALQKELDALMKALQEKNKAASSSAAPTNFSTNELKVAAIASKDNPIVRQAMARAMQSMNGRGLLNSSMATQAAQEAAIAKALEIAAPDTAAYYQDLRDGKQFGYQSQLNQQGYDHTKDMAGINFGYQSQLNQQGYGNQEYMARLNNDLSIANSQAQYDMKVGDVTQTNYITMIDRIQQDTTKQVQQINSRAMPYEEKQAEIRNIQALAQAQIDTANLLFKSTNGWQDQWAVAADTYSWQVEGAPEKPEDDNPFNSNGEYL